MNRAAKPGKGVCSRITRLMNNWTKNRERATIPKKEEKATTRMLWLLWQLYRRWVVSRKTRSYLDSQRGNQARWNPMQKVSRPIRKVRFTQPALRQASIREKKGPSPGKYKSKILTSKVPALWNLRTGPKKRLKDNSDAPEARHGTLPRTCTSSKRQGYILLARGRMGTPSCVKKRAGGKRVCGTFRSKYAYGQQERKTLTLPNWRPWGYRRIRRRWWRPTARCKQEKKPRYMSKNWTLESYASWRNTHSSFSREALRGYHGYTYHWTSGRKTTSHRKCQENWLQHIRLCAIVVPGLSTSSSTTPTPSSSTSSWQDSLFDESRYTEIQSLKEVGVWVMSYEGSPVHRST